MVKIVFDRSSRCAHLKLRGLLTPLLHGRSRRATNDVGDKAENPYASVRKQYPKKSCELLPVSLTWLALAGLLLQNDSPNRILKLVLQCTVNALTVLCRCANIYDSTHQIIVTNHDIPSLVERLRWDDEGCHLHQ